MALGKKAVFFTFVATIFLALLIFSSAIGHNYELRQQSFVMETRVATMNMFISDIEEDVERGVYIAGFRALIGLVDHIVLTGEYIPDVDSGFNELFFNGTIEGTNSSLMANNTFNDWMDKMKTEAAKINLIVNFSVINVTLLQDDPWRGRIDLSLGIDISDEEAISSWSREKSTSTYIEFENFEDPFYVLGTNGMVDNIVRRTNFTYFVNGTSKSNLLQHTYRGYYIEFTGAPSYLMRLEGNFGNSAYGIESLVDIDDLVSKGVPTEDKTIVDYIYFSGDDPTTYLVNGMPSWFKLDNETNMEGNNTHINLYQINGSLS